MGLVLGVGIDNLQSFVFDRYRAEGWASFVAALPPSDGVVASTAVCSGWYELSVLARLRRAVDACFGTGDLRLCEELGRYEAERDLRSGVTRLFFRLFSPERAVRHIDPYWRRFHDSGSWSTREPRHGEIVARLDGWSVVEEALCRHLVGYFGRTLEIVGNRSSAVRHRACRAHGAAGCEFAWSWGLSPSPPPPAPIPEQDVRELVHELMDLRDIDDVGRAIVDLCAGQLGCRRVTLWDDPSGSGAPLVQLGERAQGPGARCIVLTARGEAVGRLEVETGGSTPGGATFEELTRWFGRALEGARRPKNLDAERTKRLAQAKDLLGLTDRQTEVLNLVSRGTVNKDVAKGLKIGIGTVEIHVGAILRKAGVDNRTALVAWFWSF